MNVQCKDGIEKMILKIEDLSVTFTQYDRGLRRTTLPVISNLDVSVKKGEIVAVVGSSGSGKSLLAHALMGLLPANASCRGRIWFEDLLLDRDKIEKLRGRQIALIPQGVSYLDPLMKVGSQVRNGKNTPFLKKMQKDLFHRYQLAKEAEDLYPYELSGGMARRVFLSAAMMDRPRLLIADEPTPGLDLSLATRAMEDFRSFADQGNGVLLITHDIELALGVADRIAVFYAGTTVEEAWVKDFQKEETLRHPYSRALRRALPGNDFEALPGNQPYVKKMPEGCPFGPRCPHFREECLGEIPVREVRGGRVRCVLDDRRG